MDDDNLRDDPTYRTGLLIGRQQTIADVMGVLLDLTRPSPEEKVAALLHWCVQGLEEGKAEVRLMVDDIRNDND